MNINEFAKQVTQEEGKKESLTIAQVKEVLSIINKKLFGIPYLIIKLKRK